MMNGSYNNSNSFIFGGEKGLGFNGNPTLAILGKKEEVNNLLTEVNTDSLCGLPQPKKQIVNYVGEQIIKYPEKFNNLKVPQIYDSQEDIINANIQYIARSEHSQDYAGISGLLKSFTINVGESFDEKSYFQDLRDGKSKMLNDYLEYYKLDMDDFLEGLSFSYWEYIPGHNITLVYDEVIEDRFHLFSGQIDGEHLYGTFHECLDSGEYKFGTEDICRIEYKKKLINAYHDIGGCAAFEKTQRPNIEFQITDNGDIYFLQYKKGHSKVVKNFTLDHDENDVNTIPVNFVRGITPMEGLEIEMQMDDNSGLLFPVKSSNIYNFEDGMKHKHCVTIGHSDDKVLSVHGKTSFISQSGVYLNINSSELTDEMQDLFKVMKNFNRRPDHFGLDPLSINTKMWSDGKIGKIEIGYSLQLFFEEHMKLIRDNTLGDDGYRLVRFLLDVLYGNEGHYSFLKGTYAFLEGVEEELLVIREDLEEKR